MRDVSTTLVLRPGWLRRFVSWRMPPTIVVAVALIATPGIVRAQAETPEPEALAGMPSQDSAQQDSREQEPLGQPPPSEAPRGPAERMAAGMAPFDLPAFGLGAAVTLSTPGTAFGLGSISATYDLGPVHFDALFGLAWDDEGPSSLSGGLRGFVLVHRGPIADFSLGAGGSVGYIERVDGSTDLTWQVTAGAKMRAFIGGKNLAVTATIGAGVSFVDESGTVIVGGRLLGSAGFVYFFR